MTKAEQLAADLDIPTSMSHAKRTMALSAAELRRLAPMEAQNKMLRESVKAEMALTNQAVTITFNKTNQIDALYNEKSKLEARVKELEDALRFYADKANYIYSRYDDGDGHVDVSESNIHDDGGVIARKALGETK